MAEWKKAFRRRKTSRIESEHYERKNIRCVLAGIVGEALLTGVTNRLKRLF